MRSDIFVRGEDVTLRISPAPASSIENHSVSSRIVSKWRAAMSGETVDSNVMLYTWMRKKEAAGGGGQGGAQEAQRRRGLLRAGRRRRAGLALVLADKVDYAEEAMQAAEDEDIVEMFVMEEGGGGGGVGQGACAGAGAGLGAGAGAPGRRGRTK